MSKALLFWSIPSRLNNTDLAVSTHARDRSLSPADTFPHLSCLHLSVHRLPRFNAMYRTPAAMSARNPTMGPVK